MALYKPSNFYPNMDEVDLEKEEGQEFECKINANGSEVNAYKIEILSEDGVQLYEAYQNLDTPLKNDDFLTVKVKPFILKNNNITDIQFQSIEQQPYDLLSTYCPYNLWKINIDNLYNFKAKLYKDGQELLETNIKRFNYNYEDKTYDIVFTDNIEEEYDEIKIYLANDFNYKWNIRLYEHKLDKINSTEFRNNTFVTEGYLVGSTGGICLTESFYKNNKLLSMTDNEENYNYLQFEFTEDNSNFFKEEISQGLTTKGYVQNVDNILLNQFYCNFPNYPTYSQETINNTTYYNFTNVKINDAILVGVKSVKEDSGYKDYNGHTTYWMKTYCTPNTDFYVSNIDNPVLNITNLEDNVDGFDKIINLGGINAKNITGDNVVIETNDTQQGVFIFFPTLFNTSNYSKSVNVEFEFLLYDENTNTSYGNNFNIVCPFFGFQIGNENDLQIQQGKIHIEFIDKNLNTYSFDDYDFACNFEYDNYNEFYNGSFMFSKNVTVPNNLDRDSVKMSVSISFMAYVGSTLNNYINSCAISIPGVHIYANGLSDNTILLENNNINFNNIVNNNNNNNIYIDYRIIKSYVDGDNVIKDYVYSRNMNKIDSFNYLNKSVILNDSILFDKLKYFNTTLDESLGEKLEVEYKLKFYQRIKVYDFKNILYNKNYFAMFILDQEMNYIPYDNSICYLNDYNNLYNKTTVCVPKDSEVNIERYIRFPSIDCLNNLNYAITTNNPSENLSINDLYIEEVNDKTIIAYDKNSMTIIDNITIEKQSLSSYTQVKQSDMTDDNVFCLHKIIGWDPDTNEIRFENELERELEWYDTYEIWEKVINSADLQGAYYKKLTEPLTIDNYWIYSQESKIINNNTNQLFIQPNINMKSDKFYMPQLVFNNQVYNIKYNFNNLVGLLFEDNSLFNIENSQYRLTPVEMVSDVLNIEWYKVNSGFVDSIPENYFYAKDRVELNVTAIALFDNIETLKTIPLVYGQTNEISGLDFKFIGSINNLTIKRYRYQMFESNTGIMVYDSNYLYDDKLEMYIQGLIPDCGYVLVLEVETDFGLIYKQDYDLINKIEYVNVVEEGGVNRNWYTSKNITGCIIYANRLALPMKNTVDENVLYNDNLMIYKYDNIAPKWDYVATIDNNDTQVIMDYNIRNDNAYQYVVVGFDGSYQNDINQYTINLYKFYKFNPAKTCFNTYTISDIYKIKDGFYEVGESWNLKYNLENGDVTSNFGSTRHDTMGRYGMVTYNKKNYDSGQITCLLGDIVENKYTEIENNNNMRKLLRWKDFITNGNLKLLKDIKGNKWIVSAVDNPNAKYNNNSNNVVMTTISFQWIEVMSSENIIITNICSLEEFENIEQTSALISASTSSFGNISGNIVVAQNTLNNGDIVVGAGENRIKTLDGIIFDGGSGE